MHTHVPCHHWETAEPEGVSILTSLRIYRLNDQRPKQMLSAGCLGVCVCVCEQVCVVLHMVWSTVTTMFQPVMIGVCPAQDRRTQGLRA